MAGGKHIPSSNGDEFTHATASLHTKYILGTSRQFATHPRQNAPKLFKRFQGGHHNHKAMCSNQTYVVCSFLPLSYDCIRP